MTSTLVRVGVDGAHAPHVSPAIDVAIIAIVSFLDIRVSLYIWDANLRPCGYEKMAYYRHTKQPKVRLQAIPLGFCTWATNSDTSE